MPSDLEKDVFENLCEVENSADVFEAVEPLNGAQRTVESEVLINAAGYMMGNALLNESRKKNK